MRNKFFMAFYEFASLLGMGKIYSNEEFCPSPDVQLFGWVEGVVVGIL